MYECFTEYWDNEIKPLAIKCAEGAELISKLERATTENEKEAIKEQMEAMGKKDWYAPWYICQMIFYVEHDLADGRNPLPRIFQVRGCLSSEDYYRDVFKGEDCEEARNYRGLSEKLGKALSLVA